MSEIGCTVEFEVDDLGGSESLVVNNYEHFGDFKAPVASFASMAQDSGGFRAVFV